MYLQHSKVSQNASLLLRKAWIHKYRTLVLGVGGLFFLRFIAAYAYRLQSTYLDTAGFLELIDRKSVFQPLNGDYFRSARGLVPLINTGPEKICSVIPFTNFGDPSFFGIHPYLIATPISALSWLLPFSTVYIAAAFLTVAVVIGLVAVYFFLTRLEVSRLTVAFFILAILIYPVLVQSLGGQAYFDRLMFGPGVLLVLLVWWSKFRSTSVWKWICVSGFVLALISERGAALASLLMVGYLFLLHGKECIKIRELRRVLIFGVAIFCYLATWATRWQDYESYGQISITLMRSRVSGLFSDPVLPMTKVFLLTSVGFFFLALFSGRAFVILLISMASNVLISVGGAELTGFRTHYHQTYLPVAIAAAAIGLFNLDKWFREIESYAPAKLLRLFIGPILIAAVCVTAVDQVYSGSTKLFFLETQDILITRKETYEDWVDKAQAYQEIGEYVKDLPKGTVSVPEGLTPAFFLAGIEDVEYWPMGVGKAEVLVVPSDGGGPNPYPLGFWGDIETLRGCLRSELGTKYNQLIGFDSGPTEIFVLK